MAWLKVYENDRFINIENIDDNVDISSVHKPDNLVRIRPQCVLFDRECNRIEEVYDFLQKRKDVNQQEWNTIEAKGRALKLFYDFLEEFNFSFDVIGPRDINDFIAWLFKDHEQYSLGRITERTGKTVNTYISHIRDFYRYHSIINDVIDPFLNETELINRPSSKPKGFFHHTQKSGKVFKSAYKVKETGKKPITILGKDEIRRLLSACTLKRDRLIIALMLYTGMRIGEVLSLKIQAIGIPEKTAEGQYLKMIPTPSDNKRRRLKTGIRDVVIPSSLMRELDNYYTYTWLELVDNCKSDHEYFFISEGNRNRGEPLSYGAVESLFKRLFKKTGINAMPHDFRHTYATNLARQKTDISTLASLLGHKSDATVGIYIKIAKKKDVVKILEEFYDNFDVMDKV